VFFAGPVTVLLGAQQARTETVMDGLGLVVFEYLDGRGDLVTIGGEDDALDGTDSGSDCVACCRLVCVSVLRSVLGIAGAADGRGLDEGPLAEIGLADLHGVEESGRGGPVGAAAGEGVGDTVEVGLDGDAVLRELELDGRVELRLRLRLAVGYGDGSVVEGLCLCPGRGLSLVRDLAAVSGVALPVADIVMVAAEILVAERGCGTLGACAEDVPAGLEHGVYPPPRGICYLPDK